MNTTARPVNRFSHYHAHIYFDTQSQAHAKFLCEYSAQEFELEVGRFHQRLVGPHPCWSCQVSFSAQDFDAYINWLEAHRQGLSVLVHPLTGNDWRDHSEFATWLGQPQPLKLDMFKRSRG